MDSTQEKILYAGLLSFGLVLIGAIFYKTVEGWDWVDSTYFAVSTLMTVGFGDLHSTHSISRIFTTVYMLIGIPAMLYTVTLLGAYSVEKRALTKPFGIFRKHTYEKLRSGTGKAKKLVHEIERMSEDMTAKMKELEEVERENEKRNKK